MTQTYSGSTPDQTNTGLVSFMNFQLVGKKDNLAQLCNNITKIEAVLSWSVDGSTPDVATTFSAMDQPP